MNIWHILTGEITDKKIMYMLKLNWLATAILIVACILNEVI